MKQSGKRRGLKPQLVLSFVLTHTPSSACRSFPALCPSIQSAVRFIASNPNTPGPGRKNTCPVCVCVCACVPVCHGRPLPAAVPNSLRSCWLLFDLVCFGLLIKHGLCFVGGASQSGAHWLTPPRLFFPSTGVHRAAPKPAKLRQGLTPNRRHNHTGISTLLGRNSAQIKSRFIRNQYVDTMLSFCLL